MLFSRDAVGFWLLVVVACRCPGKPRLVLVPRPVPSRVLESGFSFSFRFLLCCKFLLCPRILSVTSFAFVLRRAGSDFLDFFRFLIEVMEDAKPAAAEPSDCMMAVAAQLLQ